MAWILIEAGSVLLPTFGAPEWFFRIYVMIISAGFIVALGVSITFNITGIRGDALDLGDKVVHNSIAVADKREAGRNAPKC